VGWDKEDSRNEVMTTDDTVGDRYDGDDLMTTILLKAIEQQGQWMLTS
jgi:hypothetical protein